MAVNTQGSCSKLSVRIQKQCRLFSVILREFFVFQYIIFVFQNIISGSEHKFASEHLRRNKQKMSGGKKTIEEKQTILFDSMQRRR